MGRRRPDHITKNIPATRRICRSAAIKVSASQSLDKLLRVIFPQDTFENQAPVSEDTVMEEVSKIQVTDGDDSSRGEASDEESDYYDDSADMETNLNELSVF